MLPEQEVMNDITYFALKLIILIFLMVYRDGVSESQFSQVLNIELDQIKEVVNLL